MIDSVMFWNEPNNKSHWDPEIDPDWSQFATMIKMAGQAVAGVNPQVTRVLGGISPIDPAYIENLKAKADDAGITLRSAQSQIEDIDLPKAILELQMQTVAYQAALGATAKVLQPTLLDFLR